MDNKIVVVIDVKDNKQISAEGIKYALEESYSSDELTVDEVSELPFMEEFDSYKFHIYNEVMYHLETNYEIVDFSEEERMKLTEAVYNKTKEGFFAEHMNDSISEIIEEYLQSE